MMWGEFMMQVVAPHMGAHGYGPTDEVDPHGLVLAARICVESAKTLLEGGQLVPDPAAVAEEAAAPPIGPDPLIGL